MTTSSGKVRPSARLGGHEGRLTGGYAADELKYVFVPRIEGQQHLFHPVIQYNKAHVAMLTEQGILDTSRARKLLAALQEVEALGLDGVELDPSLEGIYPNIEALVIDRTGYNVGGMLYLGRARGDAHRAPDRIWHRAALLEIMSDTIDIRRSALQLAGDHAETPMPSYTMMQHAQPTTFGHYMLWFVDALETDFERLMDLYKRLNMSPAEVGVGMTTSFPMSRERVAELLGFEGVIDNAFLAHRGMDREVETLSTISVLAIDLYRLSQDFIIWCSTDVDFMELDNAHSATSFMMAQKKNPTSLFHIQTFAIVAHTCSIQMCEIAMRDTSDMIAWDNRAIRNVREGLQSVIGATKLTKGMLPSVMLHKDVMRESVGKRFAQGTDLADTLVRETGLAFREAHRVVGTLVRMAVDRSLTPQDITVDLVTQAAQEALGRPVSLSPESLRKALDTNEGIRSRKVRGGVAPEAVREAIGRKRGVLETHEAWLANKRHLLEIADRKLADACASIIASA